MINYDVVAKVAKTLDIDVKEAEKNIRKLESAGLRVLTDNEYFEFLREEDDLR